MVSPAVDVNPILRRRRLRLHKGKRLATNLINSRAGNKPEFSRTLPRAPGVQCWDKVHLQEDTESDVIPCGVPEHSEMETPWWSHNSIKTSF